MSYHVIARLPCDQQASHVSSAWKKCVHGCPQKPWHVQGRLPFRAKDQAGLFKAIVKGVYDPLPDNFSAPLKHIMKGMLMINPVSSSSHTCPCHTLALISPLSLLLQSCPYRTLALIALVLSFHPYHFCYSLALVALWLSSHPMLASCSDGQSLCLIANSNSHWLVHLLAHTIVNMLFTGAVDLA